MAGPAYHEGSGEMRALDPVEAARIAAEMCPFVYDWHYADGDDTHTVTTTIYPEDDPPACLGRGLWQSRPLGPGYRIAVRLTVG